MSSLQYFLTIAKVFFQSKEQRTVKSAFVPTYWGEGSLEVVGSDDAVLVGVDDAEGLLELLDLLLAEEGEDVRPGLLGLLSLRGLITTGQVETNGTNGSPYLSSYINNDDMSWRSSLRDSVSRFFTSNFWW
jgi:hypothetical protein